MAACLPLGAATPSSAPTHRYRAAVVGALLTLAAASGLGVALGRTLERCAAGETSVRLRSAAAPAPGPITSTQSEMEDAYARASTAAGVPGSSWVVAPCAGATAPPVPVLSGPVVTGNGALGDYAAFFNRGEHYPPGWHDEVPPP